MKQSKLVKIWFLAFVISVTAMVTVGGITRLTRSGLSIVDWKPFTGIIPPLSESDWDQEFSNYRQTPEGTQVNSGFTISDYKTIFIWEYVHRILGRIIFLIALLPGLYLWRKKMVSGKIVALLTALVASQGLIGWLMVKSGLQSEPSVSPWMLSLHFFSAQVVLLTAYYQLVKMRPRLAVEAKLARLPILVLGPLLTLQILYGCLTAGYKAGYAFSTYPLMNGQFFPEGGMLKSPWWENWLSNPATIQFTHRWLGILTFLAMLNVLRVLVKTNSRGPAIHLCGVAFVQVLLGIFTIVLQMPIVLAAAHQLVATMLVMAYFNLRWRLPA